MSADNYQLIRRHPDGGWCTTMEFASNPPRPVRNNVAAHPTFAAASAAATTEELTEYYEYGTSIDRGPARTNAKDADQIIVDAISAAVRTAAGAETLTDELAETVEATASQLLHDLWSAAYHDATLGGDVALLPISEEILSLGEIARRCAKDASARDEDDILSDSRRYSSTLEFGPALTSDPELRDQFALAAWQVWRDQLATHLTGGPVEFDDDAP